MPSRTSRARIGRAAAVEWAKNRFFRAIGILVCLFVVAFMPTIVASIHTVFAYAVFAGMGIFCYAAAMALDTIWNSYVPSLVMTWFVGVVLGSVLEKFPRLQRLIQGPLDQLDEHIPSLKWSRNLLFGVPGQVFLRFCSVSIVRHLPHSLVHGPRRRGLATTGARQIEAPPRTAGAGLAGAGPGFHHERRRRRSPTCRHRAAATAAGAAALESDAGPKDRRIPIWSWLPTGYPGRCCYGVSPRKWFPFHLLRSSARAPGRPTTTPARAHARSRWRLSRPSRDQRRRRAAPDLRRAIDLVTAAVGVGPARRTPAARQSRAARRAVLEAARPWPASRPQPRRRPASPLGTPTAPRRRGAAPDYLAMWPTAAIALKGRFLRRRGRSRCTFFSQAPSSVPSLDSYRVSPPEGPPGPR